MALRLFLFTAFLFRNLVILPRGILANSHTFIQRLLFCGSFLRRGLRAGHIKVPDKLEINHLLVTITVFVLVGLIVLQVALGVDDGFAVPDELIVAAETLIQRRDFSFRLPNFNG